MIFSNKELALSVLATAAIQVQGIGATDVRTTSRLTSVVFTTLLRLKSATLVQPLTSSGPLPIVLTLLSPESEHFFHLRHSYIDRTESPNEFGVNTPGNQLKWDATEGSRNVFTYTHGDYQVSWAKNHSQISRAHTLVWYSQLPKWVSSGGFNNATLILIMQNHIVNVAGHYKGRVYAWDVVNEMFNEDGTWRTSVFYTTIGPYYIDIALRAAHAADPTAKLYLNDYNTDWVGSKSNAMYNLAKALVARGVPLHGIGFQCHLIVNSFPRTFQANYERFANLGLDVAITELDIRYKLPRTAALVTAQAENYKYVVSACLAVSRCVGVTVWDTSDDRSWIPSVSPGYGNALLFDSNKKPKLAYYSVADALAAATVRGNWPP
ncbi:unnamed protein product [Rhizoctonia solani]|uniref:Beta-xylanase n=1 Tax=Rhizoctonia solani TaxID=456999 RepID=A0A8H2X253_9AGAM|nr:unnamed protein product [Rhizoctonia solani]